MPLLVEIDVIHRGHLCSAYFLLLMPCSYSPAWMVHGLMPGRVCFTANATYYVKLFGNLK
jgi:hypothetical protein